MEGRYGHAKGRTMMEEKDHVTGALGRVIEHSGEAYKEFGSKGEIDLTAKAWLWKNDALHQPFDRNVRGQSMWLKDAIREARRIPAEVRRIEYETGRGGTEFLDWTAIREIWGSVYLT